MRQNWQTVGPRPLVNQRAVRSPVHWGREGDSIWFKNCQRVRSGQGGAHRAAVVKRVLMGAASWNVVRFFLTGACEEAICCRGNKSAFDLWGPKVKSHKTNWNGSMTRAVSHICFGFPCRKQVCKITYLSQVAMKTQMINRFSKDRKIKLCLNLKPLRWSIFSSMTWADCG